MASKALNVNFEGALYEENAYLCLSFAKGTTAKAQGTATIAVGAVGYVGPDFYMCRPGVSSFERTRPFSFCKVHFH